MDRIHGKDHRLGKPSRIAPDAVCEIDGCGKPVLSLNLCTAHYKKWRLHGDPLWTRQPTYCSMPDCNGKSVGKNLCSLHYNRARRSDPQVKERQKEIQRVRRQQKPEYFREHFLRYIAKRKAASVAVITAKDMKRIYASPCAYCGSRDNIEADHVIPLSKGGRHAIGNIVPACRSCNASKNNLLLVEWRYRRLN